MPYPTDNLLQMPQTMGVAHTPALDSLALISMQQQFTGWFSLPLFHLILQSNNINKSFLVLNPQCACNPQSIAQVGADANFLLKMSANLLIRQTDGEPLATMTAKQFMFGYESSITTLGNQFLPGWISFDKVGLIDRVS